ncbi:MAG TPA: PIG-L family deacetylase [Chitinophagaceae bacterium]|nr:PIG-L family deacetylase [Chitinophagaceae bacterium]
MSTRRKFIQNSSLGISFLSLPALLQAQQNNNDKKMNIVCVGAHPDDPESGCGGTLAKLAAKGHAVTIVYLTRGEAGIEGKLHEEAAAIRTKEAEAACSILHAAPIFAGQIDGAAIVNNEWINNMMNLLQQMNPDIVFTHWPIDTHKDHQCAALLTIQCYFRMQRSFQLYFFEVCTGEQTQIFHPSEYADITDVQEIKRKAVYCHTSQDPPGIYACGHAAMEEFRGREMGTKAAEAFIKMSANNFIE